MIKAIVRLVSIDDVKDFVKKANKYSYDIDLSLGKYTVDGKSIMGIFSLDLGREIEMTVHSDKTDFLDDVAEHIVNK
ncbi:MAG: HPr family phosphocarrier protein [Ruminiclostridium sp.]|nr:HPr family phosphocarrier protein [Ruminiclostridium sp.]